MSIVALLVDDILGQAADPNSSHSSAGFQAAHGSPDLRFIFVNPYDAFLERYDPDAAIENFERLPEAPDVFLIDLIYGDSSETRSQLHMGLQIVEWLSRPGRFSQVPRALFTTIGQDQPASGFEGRTIGQVLADYHTAYINKDRALSGSLLDAIRPVIAAWSSDA